MDLDHHQSYSNHIRYHYVIINILFSIVSDDSNIDKLIHIYSKYYTHSLDDPRTYNSIPIFLLGYILIMGVECTWAVRNMHTTCTCTLVISKM